METLPDISVNIPVELLLDLASVIEVGLQRAKLSPSVRKSLTAWWDAEYGLIQSELENNNSNATTIQIK